MIQTFDPIRTLINTRNGAVENLKVQSVYTAATAGATNVTLIAANATKIHRVVGWHFSAGLAGNSSVALKNGSGGTSLLGVSLIAGSRDFGIINYSGYFETSVNTALVYDWSTTAGLLNVFYVSYTP